MKTRRRTSTMASFLAFLALSVGSSQFTVTVDAFQSTCRQPWELPLSSTALAASSRQAVPVSRRWSKTATYYSNSADPPFDDKKTASSSFGDRMRNIVMKEQKPRKAHNPSRPSFVHEAVTLSEYKELVADETDRLVVVRFYAKWCRACKAAEPYFYRLAKSLQPHVKFVEVPVLEENANLHQGLGVPALPFAHIYSPSLGLVEELRMSKKEFKNFHHILKTYVAGECPLPEMDPEAGMYLSPYNLQQHQPEESDAEPVLLNGSK